MSMASANRMTPYFFVAPAVIIMAIALIYPLGYGLGELPRLGPKPDHW